MKEIISYRFNRNIMDNAKDSKSALISNGVEGLDMFAENAIFTETVGGLKISQDGTWNQQEYQSAD